MVEAVQAANEGHVTAYGEDVYTAALQVVIKSHFGAAASAYPVFNGTGANVLALQALLPRWGAVICAATAHINTDEKRRPVDVLVGHHRDRRPLSLPQCRLPSALPPTKRLSKRRNCGLQAQIQLPLPPTG
ncbi:beta-eliminating lyase-related protein [Arthrobacter sp. Leaf337]|uniref:beta-eliminating lyase-related protein n=1 Tax=Arthrobacter sp. Leaf337 TaxID=1736342 RepID=UPI003FA43F19